MSEPNLQGKSHDISKQVVWDAWLKVKENGGAAGADGVTIERFEEYTAEAPGEPWEIYYARQILRHFQPSGK